MSKKKKYQGQTEKKLLNACHIFIKKRKIVLIVIKSVLVQKNESIQFK